MRLLFAAGAFSSGGIADYSLLLAKTLAARGHDVAFLALAERGLAAMEEARIGDAPFLRLPAGPLDSATIDSAKRWIVEAAPDWVSLQFNPFALNPRGLLWTERPGLRRLLRGLPVQVMVHEIWLGIADQTGMKPRLLGLLQKPAAVGLLRDLAPRALHTSNPYYQDLLDAAGFQTRLLPLFGNIPLAEPSPSRQAEILGETRLSGDRLRIGLFSGQQGERFPDSLIEELRQHGAARGKRLTVYSAGRAPGIESLFEAWRSNHPEVEFRVLGELSKAEVSQFMQAMDAALTHYPYYLCGKSGVAAAWLEHGVPLLTAWGDYTPGEAPLPHDVLGLLRHPDEPAAVFLARQGPRRPRGHRLPEVADQLLEDLEEARQASKS